MALGSNLGHREQHIRSALERLQSAPATRVIRVSSLLENPAVGGPVDSPDFLNAVAEISTTLAPADLLRRLLEIEHSLGRDRRLKWSPRTIDLDLLLYGDAVINEPSLTVPHARMHERRFVLAPLAEIAPHVVHPVLKKSAAELLARSITVN